MTLKNNALTSNARIGRQFTSLAAPGTKPSKPDGQSILAKIITEFKDRNRKDIQKWRQAQQAADNPENPRRYLYHDLCDDLENDGHLESQVGLREMATLGYDFEVSNENTGDIDEDTTKLFKKSWFFNFCKLALGRTMKGYRLLELVNPLQMEWHLVEPRNVVPEKRMVMFEASGDKGINYSVGFENRLIEIGTPKEFGLMNKIIPQLIWKRNAQQSWAEFSEKFGMPLLTATTNKTNPADLAKADAMLAALGEAARAVLPVGTTIDVKPFAGADAYKVYDMQIERCNSEISKATVGGTMMTDNGSSKSQGEVHERNLDDKIAESDRKFIEFLVNDYLIPIMRVWGWSVPEGSVFRYPDTFDLSLSDHWKIVSDAMNHYELDDEWVSKTFNIPIKGKKHGGATPPQAGPEEEDPKPKNEKPIKGAKPKPVASFFV